MATRAIVACVAGFALFMAALVHVAKTPSLHGARPEETVGTAFGAINKKNLDTLIETLEPAKAHAARVLRGQLEEYSRTNGIPWYRFISILPGLRNLDADSVPDDWRFENLKFDEHIEGTLARISTSAVLKARARGGILSKEVHLEVTLRRLRPSGWKIVDCGIVE
jgi:hypothetical protein